MSDHANIVREASAWLADHAETGIQAVEQHGGYVHGDVDSKRAEILAVLDALVAERDDSQQRLIRAEAAEAEVERLRETIEELLSLSTDGYLETFSDMGEIMADMCRAALAVSAAAKPESEQ